MNSECPPVLFCVFNRPDLTELSFERIRAARPSRLFISADGPRVDREGEAELCEAARSIVRKIDWQCDVRTLFREKNLGCRLAISSSISWFFEHVETGIVLEDDCIAHPCFFKFCGILLARYAHDNRVMCITGNNFQRGMIRGPGSYYFSIFPHCWGWATWRRAWRLYSDELAALSEIKCNGLLGNLVGSAEDAWLTAFEKVGNEELDSWAYRWLLSCWSQSGLTATPNFNLVTNVGFDERATNTPSVSAISYLPVADIGEIRHPPYVQRCCVADEFVLTTVFGHQQVPERINVFRKALRMARRRLSSNLY